MKDEFEELIDTAFVLNGDYSIYEVMDLDRPGRHRTDGGDVYGPPDLKGLNGTLLSSTGSGMERTGTVLAY